MITINSENELVEISSYEQLLQRPRFMANLDASTFKLTRLIGVYGLESECPCGLSHCHTGHKRGYLAATDEGHETNIGHKCGKNLFGAIWHVLRRRLNADLREKRNRETVQTFQSRIPDLLRQAETLHRDPFGAHWAFHGIARVRQGIPHQAWRKLEDMIRADDGRIYVSRAANDDEIAAEEMRLGKEELDQPLYINTLTARIVGLEALKGTNNLRDLLTIGITERLRAIARINVDTAREHDLGIAAKWINSLDARVATVRKVIDEARRFLTKGNLMQLQLLGMNSKEIAQLRRLVADLPQSYQDTTAERAA